MENEVITKPLSEAGSGEITFQRTVFAKGLAEALANEDVRMALKTEAQKAFDGDNDILLAASLNRSGNSTLSELLDRKSVV